MPNEPILGSAEVNEVGSIDTADILRFKVCANQWHAEKLALNLQLALALSAIAILPLPTAHSRYFAFYTTLNDMPSGTFQTHITDIP